MKDSLPPTLDLWLQKWLDIKRNMTIIKAYNPMSNTKQAVTHRCQTRCNYNPSNFQSYVLKIDVTKHTRDDLTTRFEVIGENSQMTKIICTIFIK